MDDVEHPTRLPLASSLNGQNDVNNIELKYINSDKFIIDEEIQDVKKLAEDGIVEDSSFVEVPLSDQLPSSSKVPKRILHFSDGILEEYSSDEEHGTEVVTKSEQINSPVNTKSLEWIPYFGHLASRAGNKMLAAADFVGENLAFALGITSPKYQYEIEEHDRIIKETEKNPQNTFITSTQPAGLKPSSCDSIEGKDGRKKEIVSDSENSTRWKRY